MPWRVIRAVLVVPAQEADRESRRMDENNANKARLDNPLPRPVLELES